MKKIILSALLVSVSLVASESVPANKSGAFSSKPIDGAALYKQRCATCRGEKAQKGPIKEIASIAGMDTTILARKIRAYRDQEARHGALCYEKRESDDARCN